MASSGVELPFVSALLVLDTEGSRVAVKYWDPALLPGAKPKPSAATAAASTPAAKKGAASSLPAAGESSAGVSGAEELKQQLLFEKKITLKTVRQQRQEGFDTIPEVMMLDNCIVVYKVINDVVMYVVGNTSENELILQAVLLALDETVSNLLKNQVSKKTLVENLDLLLLSIDEIIDDGLILETDSNLVVTRVCMVGGGGPDGQKDVPLSEQSFTDALKMAREQLVRSFR